MINQLRLYEIFEDTREAFLQRFDEHASRIMKRHGFRILAMWETEEDGRSHFAYLLSWESEDEMDAGWEAFMADEEWAAIKERTRPATGQIVGEIRDYLLDPVSFSSAIAAR